MKKILPLIASFVSIALSLNAQNDSLERSIQLGYYTDYNCAIKEFPGLNFYVGFIASDSIGASERTYVTRLNDAGVTQWQREAFDSIYKTGAINRLLQVSDNDIVLAGYEEACDVALGNGYVQKVSRLTGNTIWLKTFNFTYGKGFGSDIVELPDSGFWVANKTMLYRLNSIGDSLYAISYNFGKINKMVVTPSNYILLGCNNGLVKIDTAGNVIDTLVLSKVIRNIACSGDSLYFIDAEKYIYKTDSSLTILGQDSALKGVTELNSMVVFNNRLWFILHPSTNNICKLLKWDFNFGFIGQETFSYLNGSDLDVRDILVNAHSFDLFVHERTNKLSNHLLLKNWVNSTNNTYYYNTDAGVTGFYADSAYAILNQLAGQTIVYPYFDIYVNVKNYGPVAIDDVFLNSAIDTSLYFCLPHTYGAKFSGLNLQPGDSVDVHLGWIPAAPYDSSLNLTNERYICFWTSSPGGRMDYNHGNDNNCQTLFVTNFVGINEIYKADIFSIRPNPANNELIIKSNGQFNLNHSTVSVYDLLGNILIKNLNHTDKINLDVSKLTPGIYVVKIETGTNLFTQKFVKQ
ncbi:MAG: T9SS type A sorting domain-containing protein [Bacteroidia bacterium]